MKFLKYLSLFFFVFVVIAVGYYVFSSKKKSTTIIEQLPLITPSVAPIQKTSQFSLEEAPSQSLRGKITSMTGEVNYLGRVATEAVRLVSSDGNVQQGENYITGENSALAIFFANACSINLSEKTEVDIIQTLPENIVFSQVVGIVSYTKIGAMPITIRTSYLLTQLNGAATVSRSADEPIVEIAIASGSAIMAYNDLKYVSHEVNISSGETFTFNYGTRQGVLK